MWDQDEYERTIGKKVPTRREVWAEIQPYCVTSLRVQAKPFTIAFASVIYRQKLYDGYGAACCSHKDEWNPTTGANIAKGRAISNLLDTIMESLNMKALDAIWDRLEGKA